MMIGCATDACSMLCLVAQHQLNICVKGGGGAEHIRLWKGGPAGIELWMHSHFEAGKISFVPQISFPHNSISLLFPPYLHTSGTNLAMSQIIDLDSFEDNEVELFSSAWKSIATGQEVLALNTPSIHQGEPVCFVIEPVEDASIVNADDIRGLPIIPSSRAITAAEKMIQDAHDDPDNNEEDLEKGCVLFTDLGQVSRPAIAALKGRHNILQSARNIQAMLDWLNRVTTHDKAWDAFRADLLDNPGILGRSYSPHRTASVHIDHLFTLVKEQWLNGEVIDSVMDMFNVQYDHNDQGFIFIPTHVPTEWAKGKWLDWKKELVEGLIERAKKSLGAKAFTVINIGEHWGPLCIDFTRTTIYFGDSLDDGEDSRLGKDRHEHIKLWLSSCGVNVGRWSTTVQRLDVPRQPMGSGSCGVIALNTIERQIDPMVERWTHKMSAIHRLRYLALLTRPFEIPMVCLTSLLAQIPKRWCSVYL